MNGWQIALTIGIGLASGAALICTLLAVWVIYMLRVIASGALETDDEGND